MPRTGRQILEGFDRSATDGRFVAWDGFVAAVGPIAAVMTPDDGSFDDDELWHIREDSIAERWCEEKLRSKALFEAEYQAAHVRRFFKQRANSYDPVAILDRRLQISPKLAHEILDPLLKPRDVRVVRAEMVDMGESSAAARYGARFVGKRFTALLAPVTAIEGDIDVLLPDDLAQLVAGDIDA